MNHEPPNSISDIPPSSHLSSNHAPTSHSSQDAAAAMAPPLSLEQHAKAIRIRHKTQFLDHLIRNLDLIIYAELSILYYMDCSLFAFVARALNHWFYFTPKPQVISPVVTWNRPHIVMIFVLNILWIIAHASSTPPTAGEAVRGYLHGGLLIDFVGQKSPVSRVRLVWYDLLVLMLQLVMLGIKVEKKKMDAPAGGGERRGEEAQDHDAEERGTRRSQEGMEGIELQSLRPMSEGRAGDEEDGARHDLLERTEESMTSEHPGDAFYSGQSIIAIVHIVDTIREQWRQTQPAASGSSGESSMGATAAAQLARRRLRFRIRIGGRDYGS